MKSISRKWKHILSMKVNFENESTFWKWKHIPKMKTHSKNESIFQKWEHFSKMKLHFETVFLNVFCLKVIELKMALFFYFLLPVFSDSIVDTLGWALLILTFQSCFKRIACNVGINFFIRVSWNILKSIKSLQTGFAVGTTTIVIVSVRKNSNVWYPP